MHRTTNPKSMQQILLNLRRVSQLVNKFPVCHIAKQFISCSKDPTIIVHSKTKYKNIMDESYQLLLLKSPCDDEKLCCHSTVHQ
jgi:hypothetical protein